MIKKVFVFVACFVLALLPLSFSLAYADVSTGSVDFTISPINFIGLSNYNRNTGENVYVSLRLNLSMNVDSNGYLFTSSSITRTLPNKEFDNSYRFSDNNTRSNYNIFTYNESTFDWVSGVSRRPLTGYTYYNFGTYVSSGNWSYYMPCLVVNRLSGAFTSTSNSFTNIEVGTHTGVNVDLLPGNSPVIFHSQDNIYPFSPDSGNYFYITYYYILHSDVIGDVRLGITFNFKCPEDYVFPVRTYQISADSTDWNSGFNFGYIEGYRSGSSASISESFNDGYDIGYTSGRSVGYSEGFTAAIDSGSSDNTFIGLITSALDVPLRVISSLLDYDFLGINLKQFFFSLLTLGLLIFVLRLLLR